LQLTILLNKYAGKPADLLEHVSASPVSLERGVHQVLSHPERLNTNSKSVSPKIGAENLATLVRAGFELRKIAETNAEVRGRLSDAEAKAAVANLMSHFDGVAAEAPAVVAEPAPTVARATKLSEPDYIPADAVEFHPGANVAAARVALLKARVRPATNKIAGFPVKSYVVVELNDDAEYHIMSGRIIARAKNWFAVESQIYSRLGRVVMRYDSVKEIKPAKMAHAGARWDTKLGIPRFVWALVRAVRRLADHAHRAEMHIVVTSARVHDN